jgi:N6-L-threonylcarbamoyladenine synthase
VRLLAFETSCDETSVAVVADDVVVANAISSQVRLHSEYGGVVPELAAREHLRNLPEVARAALRTANLSPREIDAVAATLGPGLPQALLIGTRAAQGFAFALGRPFVGVHHHEAHLHSPWISGQPPRGDFSQFEPHVALIASGGHTLLVHVTSELQHRVLGATLDDAAGECFDKTAKLIGLPYPGGPEMDRLATDGNPEAIAFPRPLLRESGDDFSFSGLKTSVRYFLKKNPEFATDLARVRDLCASVQAAIVDVLAGKLLKAARRLRLHCITASGGVICNRALRTRLLAEGTALGIRVRLAEATFCTDNAAMIGVLAGRQMRHGHTTSLDEDIHPDWTLEEAARGRPSL